MKVLILSCGMGGGHNAAAKAIYEQLIADGQEAVLLEHYLKLSHESVDGLVCNCYINMVKIVPVFFQLIYKIGNCVSRLNHLLHIKSPVYYMNGKMAPYLQDYLKEHPVDAIVMPHLFPAETITYMKEKGVPLPLTIAVATDYTSIPFWEETDADYYVIPHEACKSDFVRKGIAAEKLLPYGIPVGKEFKSPFSKEEERKKLRLNHQKQNILIMGGSMGASGISRLLKRLCRETKNTGIVVICGSNRRLYSRLKKRYQNKENVRIVGFTRRVSDYVKACDILYTKPGGASVTELAAVGIPAVFLKPISDCESSNAEFYTRHHLAYYDTIGIRQVEIGKRWLASDSARRKIAARQRATVKLDAAEQIVSFLKRQIADETISNR